MPRQRRRPVPDPESALYANHFEVGYNAFEFLLDFGQDYASPDGSGRMHTRIVTAPAYAKAFRGLLDRSIGDYEAAFGPITPPAAAVPAAQKGDEEDPGPLAPAAPPG